MEFFFPEDRPIWLPGKQAIMDDALNKMLEELGGKRIVASHIEGSFYLKDLFKKIVDIIEKYYDYKKMTIAYPREEIYFSTLLWCMLSKNKTIKVLNNGLFTLVHWGFGYNRMNIRISDVNKICSFESPYYSVKRVDRIIDNYLRAYIRQKCGYSNSHFYKDISCKEKSMFNLYCEDQFAGLKWRINYFYGKLINLIQHIKH